MTSNYPTAGTTVATGNSGTVSASVPFAGRSFFLYNNAVELARSNATAVCASGTTWTGTICRGPLSGTLTPAAPSCTIAYGASTCSVTLSWTTTNPVGNSVVTSNYPTAGTTVASGNSGSVPASVPFGGRSFFLYNNAVELARSNATAACASGSTWNGTICQAPITGTLTPSSPACTIAIGASTCNVTLTWTTVNPIGNSVVTSNYPTAGTTIASGTNGTASPSVPFGGRSFFLYNNAMELARSNATAACASGSAWNGTICQAPLTGTLTPSSPTCVIAIGAAACTVTLTWTTTNPVGPSAVTSNYPVDGTTVASGNSGTASPSVPFGGRSFFLYNSAVELARSNATASCAAGSTWNGTTCQLPITGTLVPSAPSCTIPAGASTCSVTLTWTTTNPVGASAVTSNYPADGTTVASGNSGSVSASVPFAGRSFFLYNSALELARSNATASCATGTSWNGSICVGAGGLSGTLNPVTPSCIIPAGFSSCSVTLTWTTANPITTSAVTSSLPVPNTQVASGNSGSIAVSVPFGGRSFFLYNNQQELARSNATGTCVTGTTWNGTSCVNPGLVDLLLAARPTVSAATVTPGASVSVNCNVKNGGGTATTVGHTVGFYLSADDVLTSADRLLKTQAVGMIPAGSLASCATTVTIPSDAVSQAYYLFMWVDNGAAIAESDEWNNYATAKLTVAAPAVRKYGTTVITHGFTRFGGDPINEWMLPMADAICKRAGSARLYLYNRATARFEPNNSQPNCRTVGSDAETVLVFDWTAESGYFSHGNSEAAGDALFALLVSGYQTYSPNWRLDNLHFIGHSRGTIVNSEVVERLLHHLNSLRLTIADLHVTTLDPHNDGDQILNTGVADDFDVNHDDVGVEYRGIGVWKGETYHDNYYQQISDLKGWPLAYQGARDFDSASDAEADGKFAAFLNGCGASIPGVPKQCHSQVVAYYLETIKDGSIPVGYNLARLGSGGLARRYTDLSSTPALIATPVPYSPFNSRSGIVNGDFVRGRGLFSAGDYLKEVPGWTFYGGGGDGDVGFVDGRLAFTGWLAGKREESRTHGLFYIPETADRIFFDYNADDFLPGGSAGELVVEMISDSNALTQISPFNCGGVIVTRILLNGGGGDVQCSFPIPLNLIGRTGRISFRSISGYISSAILAKATGPTIQIDNVHFGRNSDIVPPAISFSPAPPAQTSTSPVRVSGLASDASGMDAVTWSTDRGYAGTATLSNGVWTAGNVPLQPGPNVLRVTAYDIAGNSTRITQTITFLGSDPVAPSAAAIKSPASGATVTGSTTLSGFGTDDSGVIQKITFHLDGSASPVCTANGPAASGVAISCVWDTTTTSVGNHSLVARAWDSTQFATSSAVSITVAGPPPLPVVPQLLSPQNGATGVSIIPVLTWSPAQNATAYEVFFAANCANLGKIETTTQTAFDLGQKLGAITPGATFCWRVNATNAVGSTPSANWTFVTLALPAAPANPNPANAATAVPTTATLTWTPGSGATSHDIYFGTSSTPPLLLTSTATNSFNPGPLASGTTYFWRAVAKNNSGPTSSPIWSFTTTASASLPGVPTNPSPSNGATNVPTTPTLAWTGGTGATSHDVYFGTASTPPLVQADTASNGYNPGTLNGGTTYYWRVVAKNTSGPTTSATWSFATATSASLPGAPTNLSPSNGATNVPTTPTLTWTGGTGATSHDVYFGASSTPPLALTDTTSNSFNPGTLTPGATYYWRAIAKNSVGPTASPVFSFTVIPPVPTNLPPALVSATPNNPSTSPQLFTITARDPNGFADINRIGFLISSDSTLTANACHGYYDRATNAVYLDDDALSSKTGPLTPGSAAKIENSQCVINGPASALYQAAGTDLAIKLDIVLKSNFASQSRKIFFLARDNQAAETGWVQTGTWAPIAPPVNQPPVVVSGTPNNPVATLQAFTFTARDPNGFADINRLYFLVNPDTSIPQNTCHGLYDRPTNSVYLYDDALATPLGPLTPGANATIQNSQCLINGAASALVQTSGTDLVLKLEIGLKGSFLNKSQNIYLWALDSQNLGTGWVNTGTWTPASAPPSNVPPTIVSGTPNLPVGSPQNFTFLARDLNGVSDIYRLYFLVNTDSSIPQNTCHGLYDRQTNSVYLYNDALTAPIGPLTPGASGKIENSQCVINGPASALYLNTGNDLGLKLDIGLKGSFASKSHKVYLWAQDLQNSGTGWVQTATWAPSSTPVNLPPSVVSGTPNLPVGSPQTFTFLARDPNGYADLYRLYFLVNPDSSIPQNTCHGLYDRQTNSIYLYNDNLTAPLGPLTPGSAGKIENSQCVINGPASALYLSSGNDLGIKLDISLKGAFAARTQKVFLWAQDLQATGTGWVQTGTWTPSVATPVNLAPEFVSATPAAPPAPSQTLTVTARDGNGFADIYRLYFLINADSAIPQNTCHGLYDRATNAIYLYNDALTQPLGPLTRGAAGKIENTQCAINGPNSALFIANGNDLAIKLDVTLKGAYAASPRNIYFWVQDNNGLGTGWKQSGTWPASSSTPNQLPVVVSGTPSLPTTLSQVFTFTGRDGDGFANLSRMYFLINPNTGIPANTCHGYYDRPTNAVYLYNDALTALLGPLTPGVAGTLQNSQCAINGASSALFVASGNDLAIKLDVLRKGSYSSGTQRVSVWLRDQQGNDTGWVNTSTWVLP